jgi:hypothetical protein
MKNLLTRRVFAELNTAVATLSFESYSLPVRFRFRGSTVECRVPTWVGSGDRLRVSTEVTFVAAQETEFGLSWVFARGPAALVPNPDWEGLGCADGNSRFTDLYELLRIEPKRLEFFDERRGWGFRETFDL